MNAHILRNRAIRAARDFFRERGILEVRTLKCVSAGAMEPYIDSFGVSGHLSGRIGDLATSPEFAMKKVFAAEMAAAPGAHGIYEIAPVFRDDHKGALHAHEFTMVEWYAKNTALADIVSDAVGLIEALAHALTGGNTSLPVSNLTLKDLFSQSGFTPDAENPTAFTDHYRKLHGGLPHHLNTLDCEICCFNLLFDELVLPSLRTIPGLAAVHGFPECLAALAQVSEGIALRTEIYHAGVELANAYQEEDDAEKVRGRWLAYNQIRQLRGVAPHAVDEALLAALPDMKNTAGVAVGLERILIALVPEISLSWLG